MTFALKKDQWHVIRKKARHSYISIKGKYIDVDTCTFKNLFALKVLIQKSFLSFLNIKCLDLCGR